MPGQSFDQHGLAPGIWPDMPGKTGPGADCHHRGGAPAERPRRSAVRIPRGSAPRPAASTPTRQRPPGAARDTRCQGYRPADRADAGYPGPVAIRGGIDRIERKDPRNHAHAEIIGETISSDECSIRPGHDGSLCITRCSCSMTRLFPYRSSIVFNRNSGPAEFARAALESVAFQTRDLADAMRADMPDVGQTIMRVDGGMTASDWTMQAIADQLGSPVDRPAVTETTAFGAAYLAGLKAGICPSPDEFARIWRLERRFEPAISDQDRQRRYSRWQDAIKRTLS